jgi:AcrR family transcriptional regulator
MVKPEPAAPSLRRDAIENRDRLVDAAGQVFADRGVDVGVDEIARTAGVGMGTVYRNFPTKQALIDRIVGPLRLQMLEIVERAAATGSETALEDVLYEISEFHLAHSGIQLQAWRLSNAEPDAVHRFREQLAALLAQGQASGRLRPELVPTDIYLTLWSVIDLMHAARDIAPTAWRRHLEIHLSGFRVPGSAGRHVLVTPPVSTTQHRALTTPQG